jgi:hypothetical protein
LDCNGYLEKNINPYRKGLVGNFRIYRNLIFYGDRLETNPATATNISQNGFLSNFQPYWNFNTSNNLVPDVANTRWVWNAQATRYNIKGLELETKDALNIYTAAQYGYNKTLPIAITSNSRYNEAAYESFEDNSYAAALNITDSNICAKKHISFTGTNAQVINTDAAGFAAHSGKYVLGINAGATVQKTFPVLASVPDSCKLELKPGVINLGGWVSVPQAAQYYRYCGGSFKDSLEDIVSNPFTIRYDFPFSFNGTQACNGISGSPTYVVHFYYLPQTTGTYFITNARPTYGSGGTRIRVRPNPVPGEYNYTNFMSFSGSEFPTTTDNRGFSCPLTETWTQKTDTNTYFMCAGKPYEFVVYYTPNPASYGSCNSGLPYLATILSGFGITPKHSFYANIRQEDNFCNLTQPIYATDTLFNPIFSIPANKKMLFSAWVREECAACAGTGYASNQVNLQFNVGGSTTTILKPSGPVIEGWQRYEGEFTAPAGATQMTMSMVNNSSSMIYFDDIRIHPFSANMKSYVYDPVNLRLLAELDANNYATFYEYDEEGGLIRTKGETREGIKTINETRSFKQRGIRQVQ